MDKYMKSISNARRSKNFNRLTKRDIISIILSIVIVVIMLFLLFMKVWITIEFMDTPLSDIPAWALPWLDVSR